MNTINYKAPYTLREDPVSFACILEDSQPLCGFRTADGRFFPAQQDGDQVCMIATAEAGEDLQLLPVFGQMTTACSQVEENRLNIFLGENQVAGYCWDTALYKPYFGPITDTEGNPFTRLDFTAKEHPHHRSVYVAVGDVNGVDCWNEPADCGIIRNESITDVVNGSAFTRFTATNLWTDHDGKPLLHEKTTYTVYNQSDRCRMVDLSVTFIADCGEVVFGPTKEAGPLGIRMRDELRADKGNGRITNDWGGVGESECWGKEAKWCDYAGEIDCGYMGISAFDHPGNERYPTTWHVRDYGLFAANNLFFKGGLTIPANGTLTYKFRILFRREDVAMTEIGDHYSVYCL